MAVSVDQLRLGVAFAHAVPSALLTLHLDRGRALRCSHDAALSPDVHPCHARRLLASTRRDGPCDWLGEVVAVELGGPGLVHEGAGLYRGERGGRPVWAFATTLCPADAHDAVAEALGAAPEDGPSGGRPCAHLELWAQIDEALGVIVLSCADRSSPAPGAPEPADAGEARSAGEAARRASVACLVAELCGAERVQGGLR